MRNIQKPIMIDLKEHRMKENICVVYFALVPLQGKFVFIRYMLLTTCALLTAPACDDGPVWLVNGLRMITLSHEPRSCTTARTRRGANKGGFFGSDRSSRNANVRLFVCSMKTCLELSIFRLEQSGSVYGQSQVCLRVVQGQS